MINSAPVSFAAREKSRTLERFASGSPREHEIWATATFIYGLPIIFCTLVMSSEVETSLEYSFSLYIRDSSTRLVMTLARRAYAAIGLRYPKNSRFVIRWATSGGTICSHLLSPDCNFASTSGG